MRIRCLIVFLMLSAGCKTPPAERVEVPKVITIAPSKLDNSTPSTEIIQIAHSDREAVDDLGLAAECIERGDRSQAVEHFRRHIQRFPEQIMIRAYLAELLFKMDKLVDAQDQFERFVADAQQSDGPPRQHVVHCHTRLMEIAQNRDDDYGEHLHRGIGMILLARRLEASGAGDDVEPGFRERLLCKAAAELTKAKKCRPDEPRPHWYLVEAWTKLDQSRPAEKALKRAKEAAALLPLPPAEQRALVLAR